VKEYLKPKKSMIQRLANVQKSDKTKSSYISVIVIKLYFKGNGGLNRLQCAVCGLCMR